MTPAAPDDAGEPDPILVDALEAGDTASALSRVLLARLLVPVVAERGGDAASDGRLHGPDGGGADAAEMAVPALVGAAGARALPAFTGVEALRAWRPDARPVPMPGARVVAGAIAEGYDAVVIDVAGPHALQLVGAVLIRLGDAARRLLSGDADTVSIVEVTDRAG
jgi:hypothetical protein